MRARLLPPPSWTATPLVPVVARVSRELCRMARNPSRPPEECYAIHPPGQSAPVLRGAAPSCGGQWARRVDASYPQAAGLFTPVYIHLVTKTLISECLGQTDKGLFVNIEMPYYRKYQFVGSDTTLKLQSWQKSMDQIHYTGNLWIQIHGSELPPCPPLITTNSFKFPP
ncbi:hypothetical protein EJ04DRAFT_530155 [Polyplosphaeria fusca]|uniref:Uncharacterized protein n=1 Tax=Polyplosphaeria fusca TaxID=682080 RepID=A0A9P4QKH2_9PLEO|nr:hypothetical protein EJ04DRAFT_530155 [Polyplosphaeria fusca]